MSSYLDSINANVAIFRRTESYYPASERWGVSITVQSSDTELKVRADGPDMDSALSAAEAKIRPLLSSKPLAMALTTSPLLEAPATDEVLF